VSQGVQKTDKPVGVSFREYTRNAIYLNSFPIDHYGDVTLSF